MNNQVGDFQREEAEKDQDEKNKFFHECMPLVIGVLSADGAHVI